MALKDEPRSKRSKRFTYVSVKSNSKMQDSTMSSTGDEGDDLKNKVRGGFSIKELMKEGENFKIDEDHIYTSAKSHQSETLTGLSRTRKGRKRKLTEESDDNASKQKCYSKNALMAKRNRERKKQYISSLEMENASLRKQNEEISRKIKIQDKNIFLMKQEIAYLKSLLINSKELGQILRNLKETTGLPITSNLLSFNEDEVQDSTHSEHNYSTGIEIPKIECDQPRIRSVNNGSNFPILDKDINLGSSSDSSISDITDLESPLFDFEKEKCEDFLPRLDYGIPSDSIFNINSNDIDLGLEEFFNFDDISNNIPSEVGICLHVNQRKISLEMCSICSNKALTSTKEMRKEHEK